MSDFLKAFFVVVFVIGGALGFLRYGPPLAVLDSVRSSEVLKEVIFPAMDSGVSMAKSVLRNVPFLADQPWMKDTSGGTSVAGQPSAGQVPGVRPSPGRAPATVDSAPIPVGNAGAVSAVSGNSTAEANKALNELLGAAFEIQGQSVLNTHTAPMELAASGAFTIYLKEETDALFWTVKSQGRKLSLLEVKNGAIEIKRPATGASDVYVLLHSGKYKEVKAGEKWIAAAKIQNGTPAEGIKRGGRAEIAKLVKSLQTEPAAPKREKKSASVPPADAPATGGPAPASADPSKPAPCAAPSGGEENSSSLEDNLI